MQIVEYDMSEIGNVPEMTNREKLESLSNKELASFLDNVQKYNFVPAPMRAADCKDCSAYDCSDCWEQWLLKSI